MWKNLLWAPIVLIILFLFVPDEMTLLVQGLALIGFIVSIGVGGMYLLMFKEDYLEKRANRKRAEIVTIVAKRDEQVHIREKDKDAVWRAAHTDTRVYANGKWENPHDGETSGWFAWNQSQTTHSIPASYQEVIVPEQKESLFDLINKHPHLLLIGGTGNGKTVLLRILADYKKQQGFRVIVLDSRSHPSHWDGFERYETEEKINRMIIRLHQVLRANIEALRQGHATEADFENSKVVVITDEWGRIVEECEGASTFIEIMAKESRKYGIYLIFSTQTNQASELGLDNRYKTMNCFLQLEVQNRQDGRYVKVKKGSDHLGEYEVPFVNVPKQLPTGYVPPSLEVEVFTEEELKIKQIYLQTQSLRAVVRQVLGIEDSKINSKHTDQIKLILNKLGVHTLTHQPGN